MVLASSGGIPRAPPYSSTYWVHTFSYTGLSPCFVYLSRIFLLKYDFITHNVCQGYFLFNRLYLGNRFCFLFLQLLRCFSSLGCPYTAMYLLYNNRPSTCWVPPFGYLRISAYLLLPVAFRRSSRPSSSSSAKAFPVRSFFLYLTNFFYPLLKFFLILTSSSFDVCDKYYPIFKDLYSFATITLL